MITLNEKDSDFILRILRRNLKNSEDAYSDSKKELERFKFDVEKEEGSFLGNLAKSIKETLAEGSDEIIKNIREEYGKAILLLTEGSKDE